MVIMAVREHHGNREVRDSFHARGQVPDATARINEKGTRLPHHHIAVVSEHIHDAIEALADLCDVEFS